MNYKEILLWLIEEEDIYIIDTREEGEPRLYTLEEICKARVTNL